jgi:dihydrofolate reductase
LHAHRDLVLGQAAGARLVDELDLAISPVLLGQGEPLLAGLDLKSLGYQCIKHMPGKRAAAHVYLQKQG